MPYLSQRKMRQHHRHSAVYGSFVAADLVDSAASTVKSLGGSIWIPSLDDWQYSDGTTAASSGAGLGRINDDGIGLYPLLQATAANKPTLQKTSSGKYYAAYDGVNDVMTTDYGWTLSDGLALTWCGAMLQTPAASRRVVRIRSVDNNAGVQIYALNTGVLRVAVQSGGVTKEGPTTPSVLGAASVISARITNTDLILFVNGAELQRVAHGLSLSGGSLYVTLGGDVGVSFANNSTYGAAVTMGATDAQLLQIERGLASLAGITL